MVPACTAAPMTVTPGAATRGASDTARVDTSAAAAARASVMSPPSKGKGKYVALSACEGRSVV